MITVENPVSRAKAGFSAGFCVVLGVCEYLALAALAYVMMRFWDRPVRRMLKNCVIVRL